LFQETFLVLEKCRRKTPSSLEIVQGNFHCVGHILTIFGLEGTATFERVRNFVIIFSDGYLMFEVDVSSNVRAHSAFPDL